MKKIIFLLTILLSLSSCSVEMTNNGDLDGFWQMYEMQVDGGEIKDMRNTGNTMGVNFNIMSFREGGNYDCIYCRFDNDGTYLRIYDFRVGKHDITDLPVEDPSTLNVFGIFSLDEKFKIETMTSSSMILRSERALLKLRKY